jgi:hypothetical protein
MQKIYFKKEEQECICQMLFNKSNKKKTELLSRFGGLALFINVEKNNYSRVSGTREHRSRVK